MKRKKKNPYNCIEEIIKNLQENSKIKNLQCIGEGADAEVYYFNLPQKAYILNDIFLNQGEYVIKILKTQKPNHPPRYSEEEINRLKKYSKYGIIPKIYYIDKNSIIMKYIKGITLKEFRKKYPEYPLTDIRNRIIELENIWWKIGKFTHSDLHDGNILITKDLKVYLIDPI